eukprot:TCALIF_07175-PA protein Name:"Protein of unknown function" AED:0.37 eAED:0.37 QI:0/0/0.16/0.5/1/1/6/45/587
MTRRISRENLSLTVSPSSDSIPSYMKSTSASSKKERPVGAVAPQNGKRRSSVSSVGGAQSIGDLRQIIKVDDDSSSEETNRDSSSHSRRRSNSQDRRGGTLERSPRNRMGGSISNLSSSGSPSHPSVAGNLSRSERDLTKVTKVRVRSSPKEDSVTVNQPPRQRTKMKTTTMIVNEPISTSTSSPMSHRGDIDVVRAPLNWQLAEATAKSLQLASDNLVQLYKRISLDYDLEETQRTELLRALAGSAGSAQHTLRPVAPGSNHLTETTRVNMLPMVSLSLCLSLLLALCPLSSLAFNIVKTSFQEEVATGDTIKLSCKTDGYYEHCVWRHKSEVCEYEWKKSHDAVLKQRCSHRIDDRIRFVGEYYKHECSIEIAQADLEDAGSWECEMESYVWGPASGTTDKKTLKLKVETLRVINIVLEPIDPKIEPNVDLSTKDPKDDTKDVIESNDFIDTKPLNESSDGSKMGPTYSDISPRIGIHEPIDAEEDYVAIINDDEDSIPFIGTIIGGSLLLVLCVCIAGYLILRQRRRQLLISDWKDHQSKSNPKSSSCKVEMNTILDDVDDITGPYDNDPEMNHPSPLTSRSEL